MKHLSIVPPTRLLVAGRQDSRRAVFARRPQGTADWLFIYTEKGQAYFRSVEGEFTARADDVILVRPGTPHDYGLDPTHGYWKNAWTHFLPRPDCLHWLRWPEVSPGLMHLRLPPPVNRQVRAALSVMHEAVHSPHERCEELAVNALERALLLCDGINPRHEERRRDPRIDKAVRLLCATPETRFTLGELARHCGLSRSRFAELFRVQTGIASAAFLEGRRMRRARELLAHTSFGLSQIAEQCGFASPFYFSLRFKKFCGINPRTFRQTAQKEAING